MAAPQTNLTDRLLSTLIDKNSQGLLYEQGENPWPGGSYTLQVFKDGEPSFASGPNDIRMQMPIRVAIKGDASNKVLNMQLSCAAQFGTVGVVELTPIAGMNQLQLQSRVDLPVPVVNADCGGMQLPIQSYLQAFIAQNKPKWERDINTKVNAVLSGKKGQ